MEDSSKRKREMETKLIEKVSEVISAIESVKHVVEVVCALHSLALLPSLSIPLSSQVVLISAIESRSLVPRSLQKKRGGSGGKCYIKEWLHEGSCFLLASLFPLFSTYTCL